MSSSEAPRCRHIKVNGTQCGSPALRSKNFCFYHQQHRPLLVECYSEDKYATGEIDLPIFEDAHSIQSVIRQVVQMVLQKRIERKTASLILYALQIASSNLKRIELEKPQPEQVVTHVAIEEGDPIAVREEPARESSSTETDEELPPGTIHACSRPSVQDVSSRLDWTGSQRNRLPWNPTPSPGPRQPLARRTRKESASCSLTTDRQDLVH